MTRVGVVVPSYNYARFLTTCLESVLGQRGVDVRVIVIDNSSTDDSVAVAQRIADGDARVEVRAREHNLGLIASLNEGVRWSIEVGNDLTLTLSADDAVAPGALARAAAAFDSNPDVGLVYGRAAMLWGDSAPPPVRTAPEGVALYQGLSWVARLCRTGRNPLFDPEVVVRTSVYQEVGGYNGALPHTSDMEMWLRCAARADVARIRGGVQAFYRVHGQQRSRSAWTDRIGDLEARRLAYDEFFRQDGRLLPAGHDLDRLAYKALSLDALRLASGAYSRGLTDRVDVNELVDFSRDLYPASRRSPSAAALRIRQHLGPTLSRPLRMLELPTIARGLQARTEREVSRRLPGAARSVRGAERA